MLNCTVCGHDNLPVTNSSIYGFSGGRSLQMVQGCHQCGARITEKCLVCDHLHPLGTTHCSLSGIRIQDFVDQKSSVESRIEAFKNSDAHNEIAWWRKFNRWLFIGLFFVSALVISTTLVPSSPDLGLGIFTIFFMSGFGLILGIGLETIFVEDRYGRKIIKLWHKMGNREHVYIHRGKVGILDNAIVSILKEGVIS